MDIELTITNVIIARAILLWLPGLSAAITILRRRHESWRFRSLSILMIIGLSIDIAYHLLAFILSNPGQGAEGS